MTGTKFTTRRWYLSARSRRKGLIALAFLLPGIIYYIMFRYAPMWGNLIAFQDFNPYIFSYIFLPLPNTPKQLFDPIFVWLSSIVMHRLLDT